MKFTVFYSTDSWITQGKFIVSSNNIKWLTNNTFEVCKSVIELEEDIGCIVEGDYMNLDCWYDLKLNKVLTEEGLWNESSIQSHHHKGIKTLREVDCTFVKRDET